jgi:hypothetical protein
VNAIARIPAKSGQRSGLAALQSVMVLGVCLVILLGMQFLWNPDYGGPLGLLMAMEEKVIAVLNGGAETMPDRPDIEVDEHGGDGETTSPPPDDNGHVDPLWDDFPADLAAALADRVVERREADLIAALQIRTKAQEAAKAASKAAADRLQQALRDPGLSPLERLDLENKAAAARIALRNAEIETENLKVLVNHEKSMMKQFTRSVAMLDASMILVDAEKTRQQLIADGRYDEAWRVSCGAALETISTVAASFSRQLPGISGSIAAEAINTTAEMAGHKLADNTFPAMVDLSHWLYGKSWWPKNIRPRFPPGYRPSNAP